MPLETIENISKFRALTDTSTVVAHDLCAQLHVLQFCLEELEDHVNEEGKEFLKRMEESTRYISNLMDAFRKGLKLNLNDRDPYPFDDIYNGALELLKNHYFVVLERVSFNLENTKSPIIKDQGRKLMITFFALYSIFLDELKSNEDDKATMVFKTKIKVENSRFACVTITTEVPYLDMDWFNHCVLDTKPSKGKMRQFLGLTTLSEMIKEDASIFVVTCEEGLFSLSMTLPLDSHGGRS